MDYLSQPVGESSGVEAIALCSASLFRELLLSLLSFNVGIEAVQLGIIAVAFALLTLLRRTSAHRWALPAMTAPIVLVSLYCFCDRVAIAV